jgi:D-3-phosphoglycerate dehydrogenase
MTVNRQSLHGLFGFVQINSTEATDMKTSPSSQDTKIKILNMADITACPDVFSPLAGLAEVTHLPANATALLENIADYDIYFASLYVRLTSEVIARAERLRAVVTPSTGLDHLDLASLEARNIALLSLKEDIEFLDRVTATAEMAWALLLATVRRLPFAFDAARSGHWARDEFRGHQISGKTLGVLGYGRLGKIVAEYAKAFRMRVLACETKQITPAPGVQMVDFATLLRDSDVISIHIHLNEANRHFINADALRAMKFGAVLINTSRGAIIDERALLEALENGHLGGAGLDVIEGEWREDLRSHPLIAYANHHQNLVISPHTGGVTYESQQMAYTRMVEKLKAFL